MFWSKNKKKVYPCKPLFYYIKVVCKGLFVTRTCFRDDYDNQQINVTFANIGDSDQAVYPLSLISHRCALGEYIRTYAFFMRTVKTLMNVLYHFKNLRVWLAP